ncbi:VOC family protein [Corallococcus sp. M34]|uniref:VOC family protein n=1 Tax=Citreicoccus inhibens TaxID=2849499 RepID=UPI001C238639|nr:VOC family protein [Citreicoccus inhibens]MBU8898065.1 VOC family protein [Citreicoccus inhibens]
MNLCSVRLIVRDIKTLVAFYEAVTTLPARWLSDDFAEIRTPACTLAIGSERTVKLFAEGAARAADNHTAIIEFLVEDVDAAFVRLGGAVTELVQSPTTMPWGNRSLLIRDPEGNLINLFAPVTEAAKQRFLRP